MECKKHRMWGALRGLIRKIVAKDEGMTIDEIWQAMGRDLPRVIVLHSCLLMNLSNDLDLDPTLGAAAQVWLAPGKEQQ